MLSGFLEVVIGGQQNEVVPATELDEQGIDGSDLHPAAATGVAYFGRFDMVFPVWLQESECGQSCHQFGTSFRPREALQQFLQDESGCEDLVSPQQRIPQRCDLGRGMVRIPTQRERPDARIDEHAHRLRARSAL